MSQRDKRDGELSPRSPALHRPGARAAGGDTKQGLRDGTSTEQHSCGTGGVGLRGWPWVLPDYPASPPTTAASRVRHRFLPSHQGLAPSCPGVAKHVTHPALRMLPVFGGSATSRGPPGRGRGNISAHTIPKLCLGQVGPAQRDRAAREE